jgi:hypothetical protein
MLYSPMTRRAMSCIAAQGTDARQSFTALTHVERVAPQLPVKA